MQRIIERTRRKDKIRVAFLVIHSGTWKSESVYNKLEEEEKFEPWIVICPYLNGGKDAMRREIETSRRFFKGKRAHIPYKDGSWHDLSTSINPDIVVITNPWPITDRKYVANNFKDSLVIYIPYHHMVSYLHEDDYNKPIHNIAWKVYIPTPYHKYMSSIFSFEKGKNFIVSGYPWAESLNNKHACKKDKKSAANIIWAPHQTIYENNRKNNLGWSTFLTYAEHMLDLKNSRKDLKFAFRPHPLLREKLSSSKVWGVKKTDDYYAAWEDGDNSFLSEGPYVDVFEWSDAMIHDSGSFVAEYLYTKKPILFLENQEKTGATFNSFGKTCLSGHYIGHSIHDISCFLEIAEGRSEDFLKEKRLQLYSKHFNTSSPSEFIVNDIKKSLGV